MRIKILISLFICSLFSTYLVSGQETLEFVLHKFNSKEIPYISVDSLAQNKDTFYLLDAREQNEFDVSHLEDAFYVGFDTFEKTSLTKIIPDTKTPIAVYCSLGIRSHRIAQKLKKMGYTKVYNLYGGIFEWKNHGYPVFDNYGSETEKVHAYSALWGMYLKKGEKVYD